MGGHLFFERQTMKLVDMSRKHAQMIMYILCMVERIFGSVYIAGCCGSCDLRRWRHFLRW